MARLSTCSVGRHFSSVKPSGRMYLRTGTITKWWLGQGLQECNQAPDPTGEERKMALPRHGCRPRHGYRSWEGKNKTSSRWRAGWTVACILFFLLSPVPH
jgi:hypothetical protein